MSTEIRLLVTDYRVICYKILGTFDSNLVPEKDVEKWIKCQWAIALNRGNETEPYSDHTLAIVDDNNSETNPYWRKLEYGDYKSNRREKPPEWNSIHQLGLEYIHQPNSKYWYFTKPGYEADDFAGAIISYKRKCQKISHENEILRQIGDRKVDLYTVDSDWLQLVGDGVTWHDTGGFHPRIRNVAETLAWCERRLKVSITHPQQIVDVKVLQGDKSDNLPPNSRRSLIDLINVPQKYNLLKDKKIMDKIHLMMLDHQVNVDLKHLKKARDFCQTRGYPIVS